MKTFKPKIDMHSDHFPGYGGPESWAVRGVFDNRLLFRVSSHSDAGCAVDAERERLKWEKKWPSKAAFLKAISARPLASNLCHHCGKPNADSLCLNKHWHGDIPECRAALDEAIAAHKREIIKSEQDREFREQKRQEEEIAEHTKGFHWRNGKFFLRLPDGSVRISKHEGRFAYAIMTIPENEWASIVCSVSREGESGERWEQARQFHGESTTLHPAVTPKPRFATKVP